MFITIKKHHTPSQRHLVRTIRNYLRKKPLIKSKVSGMFNHAGRSCCSGKITVKHKGGGHKRKFRKINFIRNHNSEGIVCSLEYDPNRSARIASIYESNKNQFFYIIAPFGLNIGDIVKSGTKLEAKIGYSLPLLEIPSGTFLHNISLNPYQESKITRAAGTFSTLVEKTEKSAKIKLSSGKIKSVSLKCIASIGTVSNEENFLTEMGKAGHSRWLNKRPSVRGVAMNPVDHPNGGGEGKKSGKGKTPWGALIK